MFRNDRMSRAALILVLSLVLAACTSSSNAFDPSDLVPEFWFAEDKKLPGERKPVFPDGVPGVPEGVPPELIKGRQQATPQAEPAPPAAPQSAGKPAPARQTTQRN